MKKLFVLLLLCVAPFVAQSQSVLHFVKGFPITDTKYTITSTDYQVEVIPTDTEVLRFSVSIYSDEGKHILNQLFKVGRYNIIMKNGEISFDNIKHKILIKGKELNEYIVVRAYVPYGVHLICNGNPMNGFDLLN